jgi:probable rRNA maturation factor
MKEPITIEIADLGLWSKVDHDRLTHTIRHTLEKMGISEGAVSVAIIGNDEISTLKEKYFGAAQDTDVISFDLRDEGDNTLDCEIIVNLQRAAAEAEARNSDCQAELNLYVVHGLLHQLGYDDQDEAQAQAMHHKEDELLEELGFGRVYKA